jgi:anti-sigma factor RsiW
MECREARNNVSALLDGALEPGEAEAVRDHIGSCAACRAVFDTMQAADADARAALRGVADSARPSGQFTARVLAGIARRGRAPAAPLWPRRIRRVALAAAAVVVIGLGAWTIVSNLPGRDGDDMVEVDVQETAPRETVIVLTTLELPSVRGLVEELLGDGPDEAPKHPEPPAEPDEADELQLNYTPTTVPTHWG